ncbi:MAG: ribosome-associated translation inhibitor RaiA [Streptococcaceae bacterium]|jgi:putative sigma-54 modulation protein|nr:ribosome-associated translation inhibitor RaiA [Streptococcaceae bacterium]
MIKFNIRGENIEVTDALRDYVEERISNLEKYFNDGHEMTAHVSLKTYKDGSAKIEVTIPAKRLTLRAEDKSRDLYGSIDAVQEKLARQIRKYKTRINAKGNGNLPEIEEFADLQEEIQAAYAETKVVRTKHVDLKPMHVEEAVLQMEMSGHDFFLFTDGDTNTPSVVYKREDGQVGILETK